MSNKILLKNIEGEEQEYDIPNNIALRSADGETVVNFTKDGVNTDDADATSNDIFTGKTAYVQGEKITGTREILTQEKNITENSIVTPDSGYDGLSKVTVNVQPPLQEKSVTENGEVLPDSGKYGLSKVTVNVNPPLQSKFMKITEEGIFNFTPDENFYGLSEVEVEVEGAGGGLPLEEKTVDLSMGDGDQEILPNEGYVLGKVTINKPITLVPENIKKNVNIGGIVGELTGGETHVVRFIDYDGAVLSEQYVVDGEDAIAPEVPDYSIADHPNMRPALDFVKWNIGYTNITYPRDIGAIYRPSDGATYLYYDLVKPETFKVGLDRSSPSGSITIETSWGVIDTSDAATAIFELTPEDPGVSWVKITSDAEYIIGTQTYGIFALGDPVKYLLIACYVGDNIISLGAGAFNGCNNLKTITTGINLKRLSGMVFQSCVSLKSVAFNDSLVNRYNSINTTTQAMCSGCASLHSCTIPDNTLTAIDSDTFYLAVNLYLFNVPDGVTSLGTRVFGGCGAKYINLPSSLRTLSASSAVSNTFLAMLNIEKIVIPEGVTFIGGSVFKDCCALRYVYIPSTATLAPAGGSDTIFYGCKALEYIDYMTDSLLYIRSSTFNMCTSLKRIRGLSYITTDYSRTYYECKNLENIKNIIIPQDMNIAANVLYRSSVERVDMSVSNITVINGDSFGECDRLNSVIFSNYITTIKAKAFSSCLSLTQIIIGPTLTTIESQAFLGCSKINSYIFYSVEPPTLASSLSISGSSIFKIYVPVDSVDVYKIATNWAGHAARIFPLTDYPGYWEYDTEDPDYITVDSAYHIDNTDPMSIIID